MPDTYTSQFSGEEIDSALRAAQIISGADTPAELRKKLEIRGDTIPVSATDPTPVSEALSASGGGVNPNLLDNWFFGRPVNQRGQTEYTGEWVYTIDRWQLSNGNGTLKVQDGSIIFTSADYFFQPLPEDKCKSLLGKTLTLSFLYADGTLDTGTCDITSWSGEWNVFLDTGSIRIVGVANGRLWVTNVGVGKAMVAAKLELGSTQTLAHKENGVWVLNEIPDFGEQLARCQRCAVDDNYHTTVGQLNYGGDTYYISVQFPCVMRTTPVITLKEISAIGWGVLPISNAEITWRGANGFFVAIKDLTSMNNFIGKSCVVTYFASADL